MSTTADTLDTFSVGELVATSLDALINAAALHLGEPDVHTALPLEQPDRHQAWLALYAASALLEQLGPLMDEDALVPFRAGFSRLVITFAEQHPDFELPGMWAKPAPQPMANLDGVVAAVAAAFAEEDDAD